MRPEEVDPRAVRIGYFIGMDVVKAMSSNPASWCILQAAYAKDSKKMFDRFRGFKTSVGKQAMISNRDTLAEKVNAN